MKLKQFKFVWLLALVVGLAWLIKPNPAKALSDTLPDITGTNGVWFSDPVFLEIAQPGNTIKLDVSESWGKLYYDVGGPNLRASIFDGDFGGCGVNTADTQGNNAPCNDPAAGKYEFFCAIDLDPANPDPATLTHSPAPFFSVGSDVMPNDGWWSHDFGLPCPAVDTGNGLKYLMYVRASWQTGGSDRINSFRLRADGGTASYDAYNGPSGRPVNRGGYAIQNRLNNNEGTFQFEFAPPCSMTTPRPALLRWQDADSPAGNPPGNPPDANISFILAAFDAVTLNRIPAEDSPLISGAAIGGNGEYKEYAFTAKPGRAYSWYWQGVDRNNGVQMWMPFDSYYFGSNCLGLTANKTILGCSGHPGNPGTPGTAANPCEITAGSTAQFSLSVTKSGSSSLDSLTLSDNFGGQPFLSASAVPPPDPGASFPNMKWSNSSMAVALNNNAPVLITITVPVPGVADGTTGSNTFTADGTSVGGVPVTASGTVYYKILNPRIPFLTTTGSDVHAGGGLGVNCASGSGNITGQSTPHSSAAYPSDVQYVVSAGGDITNIVAPIYFGNAVPRGHYGTVCRPDLIKAAADYVNRIGSTPFGGGTIPAGASGATTMLTAGSAATPVTVTMAGPPSGISGKQTLFVYGDVHITGNIKFNPATKPRASLPAFGVIATGKILIDQSVTSLDGYYYAGDQIDTCYGTPTANCSGTLTIRGLMMANRFRFARTGPTVAPGPQPSEVVNFLASLYLAPPPAFADEIAPLGPSKPNYEGERQPLY